ncbi:MAG TPA: hypothetical protein VHB27_06770 [Rhodopila sp.]|uniref:hypothetical protein n=1 Tax=Rhodopila sp. TaxID=2480087 RepID=UPI002C65CB2C|nr:hypothetical protein [Rhodopila sp.]HVY14910.1 hypothetical protein [Rhodopila sp.]
MRRLVTAFAAFSLIASQSAFAARPCTSLSDQSTFEIQALRSELMVLATGCHDDTQYNAFIRRYQPELQANERQVAAYFQHRYGRLGQTEHDRFVTDLANAMSRQGSEIGGDFCARNGMMFHEVLALKGTSELSDYAAGKDLIPASISVCTPMATREAVVRKAGAKAARK